MTAPAFKRIMLPKQTMRPPAIPLASWPYPRREQLESRIVCETRQALARRYARRSTFATPVYVWCDTHARAAGMGDHHPIWHERQRLAGACR